MGPSTRGDSSKAFQHLLSEILEVEDTEPIALALSQAGMTKITQLLSVTGEDLDSLTYTKTGSEDVLKLPMAHSRELCQGISYYKSFRMPQKSLLGQPLPVQTFKPGWLSLNLLSLHLLHLMFLCLSLKSLSLTVPLSLWKRL